MKKALALSATILFGAFGAFAQAPAIFPGGVVNNSSFAVTGLPSASLAPGSIFTLFGTNLGPTAFTPYAAPGVVPTTLANVTVTFTVNGTATQALLYYVLAGQIGGIVPSDTPVGTASVVVTYNGVASAPQTVPIVASSFGITSLNGSGTGPAAIQLFPSYAIPRLTLPAQPGGTAILYGTGLGAAPGGDQDSNGQVPSYGTNLQGSTINATLYVGGIEANILYAGRSAFVGLDQINFSIPSNAPTGCYVPVILTVGGIVSNAPSLAISSDGTTCSDPMGLTSAEITQAETSGLTAGSLLLTRLSLPITFASSLLTVTEDTASAHFYQFSGNGIDSPELNRAYTALSSFGSCQVTYCSGTYSCVPTAGGISVPGLDAGSPLSVSGSGTAAPAVQVPEVTTGNYFGDLASSPIVLPGFPATPSDYLAPGTFTFAGPGGGAVGSFTASIAVPAPLTWSSPQISGATPSISTGSDLTVNWTDSSSTDYILITISSAASVTGQLPQPFNSAAVTCLQPASLGTYTVPSWIMQALPPSGTVSLLGGLITQPAAAVVLGVFNLDNTVTVPGVDVTLANSLVTSGENVTVTQ